MLRVIVMLKLADLIVYFGIKHLDAQRLLGWSGIRLEYRFKNENIKGIAKFWDCFGLGESKQS